MLDKEDENEFVKEEAEVTIMQVSEDIVLDNMLQQIEDSVKLSEYAKYRQSFFPYFEKRYRFMMNRYEEGSEARLICSESYDGILNKILDKIVETHGISVSFPSITLIERKEEYVKNLYTFLVCRTKENLTNMLYYSIMDNKEILAQEANSNDDYKFDLKSLSYQNIRRMIDNRYTPMVFFIRDTIESIKSETNEEFLEFCIRDEEEELVNYTIERLLIEQSVADISYEDSFDNVYKDIIRGSSELHRDVKIRLIEKLKDEIEEETE